MNGQGHSIGSNVMHGVSSSADWAMGIVLENTTKCVVSSNRIKLFQRSFAEWGPTNYSLFTSNITRGNALANYTIGPQTLSTNNIV